MLKSLFSLAALLTLLIALGTAKVLFRTNPILGISIFVGCGLLMALLWWLYPKVKD